MILPSSTQGMPYDDAADGKALEEIAEGNRESFHQLYERYAGLLFTTIQKVLNDRDDSDEVLQEVMNSLWQKSHLYHPGRGRPVTWLASTARNRAIDRLRSKKRQARLKEALSVGADLNQRGTRPVSGPEAAIRRDACSAVRSAVLQLTDIQRQVIEKVYFEGLSQQEIADQLGEPLGTVKARIRRGLAKLRQTVEPD
ncbi:MAG: sigma-70 family RNA polymerase sigma factor [Verrucomicrobiales bacterium]|nr:sigma-70 family RNA polymerase sigma factor [Verrucomicrobiales bacterium]